MYVCLLKSAEKFEGYVFGLFLFMSSVTYNLKKKLEWMSRRIRRIDVAGDIKDWVEAMAAINRLMKVDVKVYSDE